MSVIWNSPVHFYKPVECSKFVYGAPVERSIFLEKDAVEPAKCLHPGGLCPKKGKKMIEDQKGANFTMWPYVSIPGSSPSFKVVR